MAYELYWISGSPNSWRVILMMEVMGLSYASHRLDPSKGEHKSLAHLARNPWGKVPVLVDNDFTLYESRAIMAYLQCKHPESTLFGSTPQQAGLVWQRIFEVMNYASDAINDGVVRPIFRGLASGNGAAIKTSAIDAHKALQWVEGVLTESPFLAGKELSAADIAYIPVVQGLRRIGSKEHVVRLQLGFDDFNKSYPRITTWIGRIESLPGYDNSYPPHWREA